VALPGAGVWRHAKSDYAHYPSTARHAAFNGHMANCNEHVAEENITAPAHTQRVLHGAQGS
jgi:hypothetical protein